MMFHARARAEDEVADGDDAATSGEGDNDGHDARTGIGTDRFIDTLTHLFACAHTHVFTQTCNIQKCSYTLTTHEHTYA